MMFMRVDLPEPEGPMMATNSPRPISSETPRRACTSTSPSVYRLVTSRIRMTGTARLTLIAPILRVHTCRGPTGDHCSAIWLRLVAGAGPAVRLQQEPLLGGRDVVAGLVDHVGRHRDRVDPEAHQGLGVLGMHGRCLPADRRAEPQAPTL